MSDSHQHSHDATAVTNKKHKRVLGIVAAISAGMVFIEGGMSLFARSTALFADMLDMLGDTMSAVLGRYGVRKSERWQAFASLAKGGFMLSLGLGAMAAAVSTIFFPILPLAGTMGVVALLALGANATCFALLHPHRNDNLNIKSSYLCIRNDMISNVGVALAAAATYLSASVWPNILVTAIVSGLVIKSSVGIIRDSVKMLRHSAPGKKGQDGQAAPAVQPEPKMKRSFGMAIRKIFNKKAAPVKASDAVKNVSAPPPPAPPAV
ncbi:MAG: cation transporter [Alphaproteobacteria bacterium]|nr:cation transporter [Alphaproteobacteria bacterium]